jgi:hypothetical protein
MYITDGPVMALAAHYHLPIKIACYECVHEQDALSPDKNSGSLATATTAQIA